MACPLPFCWCCHNSLVGGGVCPNVSRSVCQKAYILCLITGLFWGTGLEARFWRWRVFVRLRRRRNVIMGCLPACLGGWLAAAINRHCNYESAFSYMWFHFEECHTGLKAVTVAIGRKINMEAGRRWREGGGTLENVVQKKVLLMVTRNNSHSHKVHYGLSIGKTWSNLSEAHRWITVLDHLRTENVHRHFLQVCCETLVYALG